MGGLGVDVLGEGGEGVGGVGIGVDVLSVLDVNDDDDVLGVLGECVGVAGILGEGGGGCRLVWSADCGEEGVVLGCVLLWVERVWLSVPSQG